MLFRSDTREILKSFAMSTQNGLVANLFPDAGIQPLYNTVDASLWYFYSVDRYLTYVNTPAAYEFVRESLYPTLKEIIYAYQNGTDFSIGMDEDGLIHAGDGLDQVTWMDVRVDQWVVTPRHGKPVEINSLWYNALKVMESLSRHFEDYESQHQYEVLAQKVKESFLKQFWNSSLNCLYDVVGDSSSQSGNDAKIRPNQIYAVFLPHPLLSKEQAKAVVDTVRYHLYANNGLRTLSPFDPEYHGLYTGLLSDRDAAYHQGTAWAFPLGAFITSYLKVYGHTPEHIEFAQMLIAPLEDHLLDGCINSIAEIFDGDEPNISRGCYAQAWSVGEILRAYTEDILPYL